MYSSLSNQKTTSIKNNSSQYTSGSGGSYMTATMSLPSSQSVNNKKDISSSSIDDVIALEAEIARIEAELARNDSLTPANIHHQHQKQQQQRVDNDNVSVISGVSSVEEIQEEIHELEKEILSISNHGQPELLQPQQQQKSRRSPLRRRVSRHDVRSKTALATTSPAGSRGANRKKTDPQLLLSMVGRSPSKASVVSNLTDNFNMNDSTGESNSKEEQLLREIERMQQKLNERRPVVVTKNGKKIIKKVVRGGRRRQSAANAAAMTDPSELEREIQEMEAMILPNNHTNTTSNNNKKYSDENASQISTASSTSSELLEQEILAMQADLKVAKQADLWSASRQKQQQKQQQQQQQQQQVVVAEEEEIEETTRSTPKDPFLAAIEQAAAKKAALQKKKNQQQQQPEEDSEKKSTRNSSSSSSSSSTMPQNPLLSSIQKAATNREQRLHETNGELVMMQQQVSNHIAQALPPPPPLNPLLASIQKAATNREQRLEETNGELLMQEVKTEVLPTTVVAPSLNLAEMVSKKALERDQRLANGEEKKMTEVKPKEEIKKTFSDVVLEAAALGRLTRLNEHTVEAIATEKKPIEEWQSGGVLSHQWMKPNFMSIIEEAAQVGNITKKQETVISNYNENDDDYEDPFWDEYYSGGGGGGVDTVVSGYSTTESHLSRLLELDTQAGTGVQKVDAIVRGLREEGIALNDNDNQPKRIEDVKLPKPRPPRFDPERIKERLERKLNDNAVLDEKTKLRLGPMNNISVTAAELAWSRRARLDRPGCLPKVKDKCDCGYCDNPSPYQTFAYKLLEQRLKETGEWNHAQPLQMDDPRVHELAQEEEAKDKAAGKVRPPPAQTKKKVSRPPPPPAAPTPVSSTVPNNVSQEEEPKVLDETTPPTPAPIKKDPSIRVVVPAVPTQTTTTTLVEHKPMEHMDTMVVPPNKAGCCSCVIL